MKWETGKQEKSKIVICGLEQSGKHHFLAALLLTLEKRGWRVKSKDRKKGGS